MTTGAKKTDFYVVQLEKDAAKRAAAHAMLAALKSIESIVEMAVDVDLFAPELKAVRSAIAQAEAAGIK